MSVRHEIPLENEQFAQTGGEYKSLSVGIKVNVGKWRSVKEEGGREGPRWARNGKSPSPMLISRQFPPLQLFGVRSAGESRPAQTQPDTSSTKHPERGQVPPAS